MIAKQISEFSIARLVFSPYPSADASSTASTSQAADSASSSSSSSSSSAFFASYEHVCLISCGRDNIRFWRVKNGHLPGFCLALNEHARNSFTDLAFEAGALAIPSLPPPQSSSSASASSSSASSSSSSGASNSAAAASARGRLRPVPRKLYASTAGGAVFQINYTDRALECIYQLHSGAIHCMRFNEGFCVTGSADRHLRVWPLDFSGMAAVRCVCVCVCVGVCVCVWVGRGVGVWVGEGMVSIMMAQWQNKCEYCQT